MSDSAENVPLHTAEMVAGTEILLEHGVRGTISNGQFSLNPLFWHEPPQEFQIFVSTYGLQPLAVLEAAHHPVFDSPHRHWLLSSGEYADVYIGLITHVNANMRTIEDLPVRCLQLASRVQYWLSGVEYHLNALADEYERGLAFYSRIVETALPKSWNAKEPLVAAGQLPSWVAPVPVDRIMIWGGLSSPGTEGPPAGATHSMNAFLFSAKRALDSLVDILNCLPCMRGRTLPMGISGAIKSLPDREGIPKDVVAELLDAWEKWARALVDYRDYTQHHGELAGSFAKSHSYIYQSPSGMIGLWVGIPDGPDGKGWPGDDNPIFTLRRDALSYGHTTLTKLVPLCSKVVSAICPELGLVS